MRQKKMHRRGEEKGEEKKKDSLSSLLPVSPPHGLRLPCRTGAPSCRRLQHRLSLPTGCWSSSALQSQEPTAGSRQLHRDEKVQRGAAEKKNQDQEKKKKRRRFQNVFSVYCSPSTTKTLSYFFLTDVPPRSRLDAFSLSIPSTHDQVAAT